MSIARRLARRHHPTARRPRATFALAPLLLLLSPLFTLLAADARAQTGSNHTATAGESWTSGTITGRVIGEDGLPLANVRISTYRAGGALTSVIIATSDGEGRFTLSNLTYGSYLITAYTPGYIPELEPPADPAARIYHHVGDAVTLRLVKGGVITGTVTDANGDPVVGVSIVAARVRYADGRAATEGGNGGQPRRTDDRGIYRLYGLRPGGYVVRAGGAGSYGQPTTYDADSPTYHPSTTRDGAAEVSVQAGQEMSGIDIRYRGEAGHAVSGTLSGAFPTDDPSPSGTIIVSLKHVSASAPELFAYVQSISATHGFSFDGVADGDYDLAARTGVLSERLAAATAAPRRITVRGADVSGLELALTALASVSGQLLFDAPQPSDTKTACRPPSREPRPGEVIILVSRVDAPAAGHSLPFFNQTNDGSPDDKGDFQMRQLNAGRYRLDVRPPAADFYLRAITLSASSASGATITTAAATPRKTTAANAAPARTTQPATAPASDPARDGFNLRAGESLTGLIIRLAPGAAALRGRVVFTTTADAADAPDQTASAGASLPPRAPLPPLLRAYLIPAEREQADNVLRYAETFVGPDGSFAFANLAPGAYRLITRPAPSANSSTDDAAAPPRPLVWDAAVRAQLRREAETSNNSNNSDGNSSSSSSSSSAHAAVELAPCQRSNDLLLRYPMN